MATDTSIEARLQRFEDTEDIRRLRLQFHRYVNDRVIGRAVANDTLCFSPPLVISKDEIDEMLTRISKSLDELTVQLRREQIAVVN